MTILTSKMQCESIEEVQAGLVGKKLVSVTRKVDTHPLYGDQYYIRYTFEGGAYTEWHVDLHREVKI
jgi:hypothetical protein